MGSRAGTLKIAAQRVGINTDEYAAKLAAGLKWCFRCRQWHVVADFGLDRTRGDGRSAKCLRCSRVSGQPGPTPPERRDMRAAGRAWCRRCRDWLPAGDVRGGLCRPHTREYERTRYALDPRYRAERKQHAHSRKRGVRPIPVVGHEFLLERFGGRCAFCRRPADTWEHLTPVSRGGNSTPGNVVPACASCNSSKKDRDLFEWMTRKGFIPCDELVERLILAEAGLWS